jgi:hypothetical protein
MRMPGASRPGGVYERVVNILLKVLDDSFFVVLVRPTVPFPHTRGTIPNGPLMAGTKSRLSISD